MSKGKNKGFYDHNGNITNTFKQIMDYWHVTDPMLSPRTESQFLEQLLTSYLKELKEHQPKIYDARNMLNF